MKRFPTFSLCLLAAAVLGRAQTLYYDRASFLGDARMTAATTASVTFDSYSVGTDLTGATNSGATFDAPGSGPLLVIAGSTGVRYAMTPSTGLNVLSPGGNDPNLQNDDLSVTFAVPVQAAGMDVVFDVPDGASYVAVYFFDTASTLLASNSFIPDSGSYQFVGLVADSALISRIVFDEFDDSANDDNVAYDSLVFTSPIPEPSTYAALGGLIAISAVVLRRRKQRGPQAQIAGWREAETKLTCRSTA
jgi:hypothetical protein